MILLTWVNFIWINKVLLCEKWLWFFLHVDKVSFAFFLKEERWTLSLHVIFSISSLSIQQNSSLQFQTKKWISFQWLIKYFGFQKNSRKEHWKTLSWGKLLTKVDVLILRGHFYLNIRKKDKYLERFKTIPTFTLFHSVFFLWAGKFHRKAYCSQKPFWK